MISIEECRKHLGASMGDKQIENLRDTLYALVENMLDDYVNQKTKCKKPSYTAASRLSVKRLKDMG